MSERDEHDIEALSQAAKPGLWSATEPVEWDDILQAAIVDAAGFPITWDDHSGEVFTPEDARYLVALVNAHRSGWLVPRRD